MSIEQIKEIVSRAAVYVPFYREDVRIEYWDTEEDILEGEVGFFYGTGEETGKHYAIDYASVNLEEDSFYELKLIEV
jgi:hypothetical protein